MPEDTFRESPARLDSLESWQQTISPEIKGNESRLVALEKSIATLRAVQGKLGVRDWSAILIVVSILVTMAGGAIQLLVGKTVLEENTQLKERIARLEERTAAPKPKGGLSVH